MPARIYYQNLLSTATFSGFNTAGSAVALAPVDASQAYAIYPYAAGNVTFVVQGTFTGALPLKYVVQITSSTDGTFANTRYRWSDDDGATWDASNLTPVSGTPVTLSNGVQIVFTASSLAPEFVLGDEWDWLAVRRFSIRQALDGSRTSEYRSGSMPTSSTLRIGFDLGSAQQPTFLAVADHNLPSNATTTLFAHASTLFTETGGGSQAVTWRTGTLAEFVTINPFRYWWLRIVMGATLLTYLRISELFLGTGATFQYPPSIGIQEDPEFLTGLDTVTLANGSGPQVRTADQLNYTWHRRQRGASGDGDKLDAALAYATQHASYQQKLFWYVPDDSTLGTVKLLNWVSLQRQHVFLDRWNYQTQWVEMIRRVAS